MVADLRLREALDELLDLLLLGRVHVELDPGVEVLNVLAHDHEVDIAAGRRYPGIGLRGAEVCVEVELLAQGDVHRAKPCAELGRERTLERDAIAADRVECVFWKGRAVLLHCGHADLVDIPADLHAGRFDRTTCGFDDLRARAVARNQRDGVGQ